MATAISRIPRGATLTERIAGTVNSPGDTTHGLPASVEVWSGHDGDALAKWIVVRVESPDYKIGWADRSYWCKRATGRNIARLEAELPSLRALIA